MKKDISKKLFEKHCYGGDGGKSKKGYNKKSDVEDLPQKESIKSRYSDRKYSYRNSNPLVRFLRSKVGCLWDDVYSEICQTSNSHEIKDILSYQVEQNVVMDEDGTLRTSDGFSIQDTFYIHPETKILEYAKPKQWMTYKFKPLAIPHPSKDDFKLICLDDVWYEIRLAKRTDPHEIVYDVVLKKNIHYNSYEQHYYYGSHSLYAFEKRQLNSKEIKKYKLR